ncbi:MAG TPA: hypothetical protein VFQ60_04860 [Patescibacteria group bacterium]|nr:hypothetical protein [Patescibacteria group bacterium]
MGNRTLSEETYKRAVDELPPEEEGPVTAKAEQKAHETGKLDPLVDPAGYGAIRRSLMRFEETESGLFRVTVGTPVPVETRVDTTGSMGGNVDVALRVLPVAFGLDQGVLPGCDVQMATGIFGDICDRFVLCRPQFEMEAEKIVHQLTLMVPERAGGDFPEDPHYGLFGAAYLTAAYINRIGLKSYDFTVSDAPARKLLDEQQLIRIFGEEVFEKAAANGYQIDKNELPTTAEVVEDLLKRAHAFFLQVGRNSETTRFWTEIFGDDRVIALPSTEMLPQEQAVIIGLTEGTLALSDVVDFLRENNVNAKDAKAIATSVARIPIEVQAALPNYNRRPKINDLFKSKTDLWPLTAEELKAFEESNEAGKNAETDKDKKGEINWL